MPADDSKFQHPPGKRRKLDLSLGGGSGEFEPYLSFRIAEYAHARGNSGVSLRSGFYLMVGEW